MSKRYRVFRICCGIIALALLVTMWFFSSQTGEESSRVSGYVARFFMRLFGVDDTAGNFARVGFLVRKAAHFSLFALLGMTLGLAFAPPDQPAFAFLALPVAAICAVTDEAHQTFVMARTGMWQDALLDCCGAVLGAALAYFALLLADRRQKRNAARKT